MIKNLLRNALFASSLLSGVALSQPFLGISVGQTDWDGYDDSSSFSLLGGYRFSERLALEAAYTDFGDISVDELGVIGTLEGDGYRASVVGIFPASDNVELFAKLGFMAWDLDVSGCVSGVGCGAGSEDGNDIIFSVGVNYLASENVAINLEFERLDAELLGASGDFDTISIGASYAF